MKKVNWEDLNALYNVIPLVKQFTDKNPIKKYSANLDKIEKKIKNLRESLKTEKKSDIIEKRFKKILKRLKKIIHKEDFPPTIFIVGAHGGVIVKDVPFCEFDSPEYAMHSLFEKMKLAIKNEIPYNLEIAVCCLEWVRNNHSNNISTFLDLFHKGMFEIINPTYSQPYNLLIGAESNIKQFEYGIQVLKELGLKANIYYCTESSLHPQIPQILKGFGIEYASLRVRLLGTNPTSHSGNINWKGIDNTKINTLSDQPGLYNGEYFHGTFFQEIPNLLFQAVSRPILNNIIYSSIEDFVMPLPFQEDIWRVHKYADLFGEFFLSTKVFQQLERSGTYKYSRDDFFLGDKLFKLSNLLLQNKKAEISLISAEIFNVLAGFFGLQAEIHLFEKLWRDLLLAQSHDAYAVPYIRTGDYSRFQLSKEEIKKLSLKDSEISISALSIQICKEIQKKCNQFISKGLENMTSKDNKRKRVKNQGIVIFNPSPYSRNDIVEISLPRQNISKRILTRKEQELLHIKQGSKIKCIVDLPPFGFKFLKLSNRKYEQSNIQAEYLYEVEISKNKERIQFKYKDNHIFNIGFRAPESIRIESYEKVSTDIEKKDVITGFNQEEKEIFSMEIIQYSKINRLEFILDNGDLVELLIEPIINIQKTLINYPFGIEETKRNQIKTLDFMLLKGKDKGLIFIQKNCPRFKINHQNYHITNQVEKGRQFEFSISFLKDPSIKTARRYVNCYFYRSFGVYTTLGLKEFPKNDFFSMDNASTFVNLWRRGEKIYLRVFNPSDRMTKLKICGKLMRDQVEILDFNHRTIKNSNPKILELKPWKIMTLRVNGGEEKNAYSE
ncbi:MAG: hypothetical protein R6U96_00415 [Promethearchaeia archaeon]